jgi:phosphopantetheine--protein transferase-like protein
MVMQRIVQRDSQGRSSFGMVAANCLRVGHGFNQSMLHKLVGSIEAKSSRLLQVVNLNVQERQYVVAGDCRNLDALGSVMTGLFAEPSLIAGLQCGADADRGEQKSDALSMAALVSKALVASDLRWEVCKAKKEAFVVPRGRATIPLPGIDVPFHSKQLLAGVPAFRRVLRGNFTNQRVAAALPRLLGKYIPNVVAKPFAVHKDYVMEVWQETSSPDLKTLLDDELVWHKPSDTNLNTPKLLVPVPSKVVEVAYTLVVELLAYQFASPVQWIKTQQYVFGSTPVSQQIEIGPAPTLTNMAKHTLQSGRYGDPLRMQLFWMMKDVDRDRVYSVVADAGPSATQFAEELLAAAAAQVEAAKASSAEAASAEHTSVGLAAASNHAVNGSPSSGSAGAAAAPVRSAAVALDDAPVTALQSLRAILAVLFKKSLGEITDNTSIHALANGKSALQNEVVGEVESEFGSSVEGTAEMPIAQLAGAFPAYKTLGTVTTALVAKCIADCMPGGFGPSHVKAYLSAEWGLGPGRTDSALLVARVMAPTQRFSSEKGAKDWLDSVVKEYAKLNGVSVAKLSEQIDVAGGGAANVAAVVDPQMAQKLSKFVSGQMDLCKKYLGGDVAQHVATLKASAAAESRADVESALLLWRDEHGDEYERSIRPKFDSRKVRMYDSYWNWVVLDAMELYNLMMASTAGLSAAAVTALGRSRSPSYRRTHFQSMLPWLKNANSAENNESTSAATQRPFLCNRATPELLAIVGYYVERALSLATSSEDTHHAQAVQLLYQQLEVWMDQPPVHLMVLESTMPQVVIASTGEVVYSEVPRNGVRDAQEYLLEMSADFPNILATNDTNVEAKPATVKGEKRAEFPASPDLQPLDAYQIVKDLQLAGELTVGRNEKQSMALVRGLEVDATVDTLTDGRASPVSAEITSRDFDGVESNRLPPRIPTRRNQEQDSVQRKLMKGKSFQAMYKSLRRSNLRSSRRRRKTVSRKARRLPLLHLKSPTDAGGLQFDEEATTEYYHCMQEMAASGLNLEGKTALVTGCGKGSIGIELLKALLEAGVQVIATTSSFSKQRTDVYRQVYEEHGSRGAKLILLPFNQASAQDVTQLVDHVYEKLNMDLDYLLPFAAVGEGGRDIGSIDGRSEAAHRMMLTNVIRLIGAIKDKKAERQIETRPTHVLLPLSPNHGVFGMDGLYAESKLGLESLTRKWKSEGWENFVTITGAVIGWTRGTGLMAGNNIAAPGVEKEGLRTFSQAEMCFNLLGLLHPLMVRRACHFPVWGDLGGGFQSIPNLKQLVDRERSEVLAQAKAAKAVSAEKLLEAACLVEGRTKVQPPSWDVSALAAASKPAVPVSQKKPVEQLAPLKHRTNPIMMEPSFPTLPNVQERAKLRPRAAELVSLRQTVVVVGFGEVGPWGNSRTRWEMEAFGEFSLEGCVELAWVLGMIKYHTGPLASTGEQYAGWVDASSMEPIADHAIKQTYEAHIMKHSGIRLIEPELFEGYDPSKKTFYRSVALADEVGPLEVASEAEAKAFQAELGEDNVTINHGEMGWEVVLRQGAVLNVPKALRFDRNVAGQIPTGWSAERLGVPKDIAESVDPVTLFTLVATVEALLGAGITDAYELYRYIHVTEVGNSSGGGMGGMKSISDIFHRRKMAKPNIASDVLQETFINVMPAWVNMLLLSSSGPIKTPVGACATAAESVDIAVDTIQSGKARVMVAGGYEDFSETSSFEFAQMKATSNSTSESNMGREPAEMCRPCSDTRGGFMESHGAGIQVLMDAELALEMGCPIYGVIAHTATATDKQGRSVPAPGRGILSTTRESIDTFDAATRDQLLDPDFRREELQLELSSIDRWREHAIARLESEVQRRAAADTSEADDQEEQPAFRDMRLAIIELMEKKKRAAAVKLWGRDCLHDCAAISPLRAGLAEWGLSADDIAVASFHGTGTKANDKNESEVTHLQMAHLGRSPGNPLLVICQKHLTGHPKGAAAGWMLNGLMQVMQTSLVPGNRNNDNTAPELRKFSHCAYPNRTMLLADGVKAGLLKSFGFGQAGGEILMVHPNLLLSTLSDSEFEAYKAKRDTRTIHNHVYHQRVLSEQQTLVQAKERAPYHPDFEAQVLLDPSVRARFDKVASTYTFDWLRDKSTSDNRGASPRQRHPVTPIQAALPPAAAPAVPVQTRLQVTMQEAAEGLMQGSERGIGLDVEPIATFADWKQRMRWVERNFTKAEIEYVKTTANATRALAGRWAAKEAVVKAMSSANDSTRRLWQGAEAPLNMIEILNTESGAPKVVLHDHAKKVQQALGLNGIKISISYTLEYAIAQAMAE